MYITIVVTTIQGSLTTPQIFLPALFINFSQLFTFITFLFLSVFWNVPNHADIQSLRKQ